MNSISSDLSFKFYSNIEKTDNLRVFINKFFQEFKYPIVNSKKGWNYRLDVQFKADNETEKRDALICFNSHPIAIQQFSVSKNQAYAEGIFVDEKYRGKGIALLLREVLLLHLLRNQVERFYIGNYGPISAKVRKNKLAQRLAESDIKIHKDAIIGLQRTKIEKSISSYGFDIERYNFIHDVGKISSLNLA